MSIKAINNIQSYSMRGLSSPLKQNFKANEQNQDNDSQTRYERNQLANAVTFIASMSALAGMGIAYGIDYWDRSLNFDKFEKVVNDPDIKKDTFLIKDVTGDKMPDMVFCKKDGTKVVFDVLNDTFYNKK